MVRHFAPPTQLNPQLPEAYTLDVKDLDIKVWEATANSLSFCHEDDKMGCVCVCEPSSRIWEGGRIISRVGHPHGRDAPPVWSYPLALPSFENRLQAQMTSEHYPGSEPPEWAELGGHQKRLGSD